MRVPIILIACVLAAFALAGRDEPAKAQQVLPVRAADSVQVVHRLLTVEPAAAQPSVVRAAQKPRAVTQSGTRPRPLFARARQLVLGDGRFRPQPFPQPAVR